MTSPAQTLFTISTLAITATLLLTPTNADTQTAAPNNACPSDANINAAAAAANAPSSCSNCEYPDLCEHLLSPKITTQQQLVDQAIRNIQSRLRRGIRTAERLKSSAQSNAEKENLESCMGYYQNAIDELTTGLKDVQDPHMTGQEIEGRITAGFAVFQTCHDDWVSTGVKDFPLEGTQNKIQKLFKNVLSLARDLGLPTKTH